MFLQPLALKHGRKAEKSRVAEAFFVRQRFRHQHFGSTRKGMMLNTRPQAGVAI